MNIYEISPLFRDRQEAGQLLATALGGYKNLPDVIVLALPRGGVPIAYEISKALKVPFDVIIVRKLGLPVYEELAMGAVAEGDVTLFNNDMIAEFNLKPADINQVIDRETSELHRRMDLYRSGRPLPKLKNKTVILVDDGIATGYTMRAALQSVRSHHPKEVIIAVPVASPDEVLALKTEADDVVCLHRPENLYAIGVWYQRFDQLTDDQVQQFMEKGPGLLNT